jgi:ABC-type glycerol-3-phosphate transport system permease component
MAILPNIGRKSLKLRFVITLIYTVLIAGSVTMVYPFLLMLSGSVKGSSDVDQMDAIPQMFYNRQIRFARFEEDRYSPLTSLSYAYARELARNRDADLPKIDTKELATYEKFLKEKAGDFPEHFYYVDGLSTGNSRVFPRSFRLFRDQIKQECGMSVDAFNKRFHGTLANWNQFPGPTDQPTVRESNYESDPLTTAFLKFKSGRPLQDKVILNSDGQFQVMQSSFANTMTWKGRSGPELTFDSKCPEVPKAGSAKEKSDAEAAKKAWADRVKQRMNCLFVCLDAEGLKQFRTFLSNKYKTAALMNKAIGSKYASFDAINVKYYELRNPALFDLYTGFVKDVCAPEHLSVDIHPVPILSARCPTGPERELWAEFVKTNLNCLFVHLDPQGMKQFRQSLAAKFSNNLAEMNKTNDTSYKSFDAVNVSYGELRNTSLFTLYSEFIRNTAAPEQLTVDTPSTRYRDYIGSNTATPPFIARDYMIFGKNQGPWLVEIMTRNYRNVIGYLAVYGRAAMNTLIYIGLSIGIALFVNPLAAYALSRFGLKSTYMILMFFLGTMAFPGAVTMIPNFLMLKNFHLLNSFWALVLPGMANGFSIFILKGFFDSIPKEIYESALLDGANEWTMFWKFTMALSKPILALITLGAFTGAYTAFMFALIICPDERMWTLMVWLFQLQQDAHQSVIYAALVLAALPTLLVFIFAQNTIMKGIVVPVEK